MVVLGGCQYTSAKQITSEFARIRDSRNGALTSSELHFVLDLAQYHPKFQSKSAIAAASGFGKAPYREYKAVWVEVTDGPDVVWETMAAGPAARAAIHGQERGAQSYFKACIVKNFRNAVEEQRIQFMRASSSGGVVVCANCKQAFPTHECEVDHTGGDSKTFSALVEQFVQTETESDPNFRPEAWFGMDVFDQRSDTVQRWKEFHRKHAELQMLSKKCHYMKSGAESSRRSGTKREREPEPGEDAKEMKGRMREVVIQTKKELDGEHPCKRNVNVYIARLADAGIKCNTSQVYGAASGLRANWEQ